MTGGIKKLGAEQGKIVRRSLISSFCRAIRIDGNLDESERALKGISLIAHSKDSLIEKAAGDLRSIVRKFEQEKGMKHAKFGALASQGMAKLGISGSAIRPNLNENGEWQKELERMHRSYESELEAVRTKLLRELRSS